MPVIVLNQKSHGAEEASGYYANRYWSSNIFPTTFEVELPEPSVLRGFAILSHTNMAAPRDFSVYINRGNGEERLIDVKGSEEKNVFVEFDSPALLDSFSVEINSDNGNGNVALSGVMPVYCLIDRDKNCNASNIGQIEASIDRLKPGYLD